ncbi:MAG: glycosyltransferase family 39 protein, partial [Methylococcales bacterium]|nr:glycosyltransferase family 39 protein [Methylococcales bacterium]
LPVWWYLECLPLLLLPWLFFKPLWQGAKKLNLNDNGVRFCVAWVLPVFVAFSLVSGKRIHYLLPLIPAFALLLARAADEISDITSWQKAHSIVLIIFSVIVLAANLFLMLNGKTHWLPTLNFTLLSGVFGLLIIVATLLSLYLPPTQTIKNLLFQTTAFSIIVPIFLASCYLENNAVRFDTKPVAQKIAQFQTQNQPIAFYTGKYHAQFQFTGRLTQPLTILESRENLQTWAQEHKDGVILLDSEKLPDTFFFYSHPYRAGELGFIEAKTLLEHFAYIP